MTEDTNGYPPPDQPADGPRPAPARIKPPVQAKPSLLLVESVYHRQPNRQPSAIQTRYSQALESEDPPVERRLRLTEEWTHLDLGWMAEVSLIVVENLEGHFRQTAPSPEMIEQARAKVIEVSLDRGGASLPEYHAHLLVPPRRVERFLPGNPRAVWLRSRSGPARCIVTAYPA